MPSSSESALERALRINSVEDVRRIISPGDVYVRIVDMDIVTRRNRSADRLAADLEGHHIDAIAETDFTLRGGDKFWFQIPRDALMAPGARETWQFADDDTATYVFPLGMDSTAILREPRWVKLQFVAIPPVIFAPSIVGFDPVPGEEDIGEPKPAAGLSAIEIAREKLRQSRSGQ